MRPSAIALGGLAIAAVFGWKWFMGRRTAESPFARMTRQDVSAELAAGSAERGLHFFYIKIPEDIQPLARASKYEDPLQAELTRRSLGEIAGGGSQLASGGGIEYCGIDVEVTDRQRGLELIVETMRRLQAPPETVVEEFVPEFQVHRVYGP